MMVVEAGQQAVATSKFVHSLLRSALAAAAAAHDLQPDCASYRTGHRLAVGQQPLCTPPPEQQRWRQGRAAACCLAGEASEQKAEPDWLPGTGFLCCAEYGQQVAPGLARKAASLRQQDITCS